MFKLESNIYAQPESLARTLRHHCGEGASAITEAATILQSRKRIIITGMGASLFASIPLQYHLCSKGFDAVAIEAGELLHYMNNAWNEAVVLIVSRSGESVEIARLIERIKGMAPIVGVTNEPESLLARSADAALSTASLHDEIVAIQTYSGTVLTLHLLGSAVDNSLDVAVAEVQRLLPAFKAIVEASMKTMSEWSGFLLPDSPVYLLARGYSLASAQEGALLFHEIAKNPAVAMGVASFRHGPVEVVDRMFRAIVFAPQDGTQDLNLALAQDVCRFGGQVKLVGTRNPHSQFASWYDLPAMSETLTPLFEIVPLQAAAYQLAIMRGIEPGSFRYAPQVAVDEASFS